jgi:hypothetical protein
MDSPISNAPSPPPAPISPSAAQALRDRDAARADRDTAQAEAHSIAAMQREDAATISELRDFITHLGHTPPGR